MNKRLVKKKRPVRAASKASPKTSPKAGRSQTVRKASTRAAASRKTASRQAVKTSAPTSAAKTAAAANKTAAVAKKSTTRTVSSANKIAAAKIVAARTASAKVAPKGSAILPLSRVVRLPESEKIVSAEVAAISVTEVTARHPVRAHKFRVGQTVSYTSSPISRPGASGSYQVVRLLPSDGDDYQYRIKNPGEAFERVAKESQLELDH
jgi:hypothetical protein